MSAIPSPIVVKVGGSLYDLPDLGARLSVWLAQQTGDVIVVPGGGPMVDVIRRLDLTHHLGEEACHWLALRTLTISAYFLARLLPGANIITDPRTRLAGAVNIVDMYPFTLADEANPGRLPHSWAVTSDSLAVRVAILAEARQLVLLKSAGTDKAVMKEGVVDEYFHEALRQAPADLRIHIVNLREPDLAMTPLPNDGCAP